ncbi:MAG: L-threonylcarbamoyladenylate synthase [Ilumatobacteraceae bacterium]
MSSNQSADGAELPGVPVIQDPATAAALLSAGGLVAIPTETVYGLAADITDLAAVARIFSAKGRPTGHPLILHVADVETARRFGVLDARAEALAMLWPGPLTMIVPATDAVPREVTGGRDTVAIRVPEHQLTLQVLSTLDGAVAAPSANRFGRVSPTTAQHVIDDLGDILDPDRDAILDGGPCLVGVESTIVDLTCDPPQILRPGGVPSPLLDRLLEPVDGSSIVAATGPARASGMLPSHYAPERGVVLVEREDREILDPEALVIDRADDPVEAARHLYDDLRRADTSIDRDRSEPIVVVQPANDGGLGSAVRDRLKKAAAPRERQTTNPTG